jgi:hypothetical protein
MTPANGFKTDQRAVDSLFKMIGKSAARQFKQKEIPGFTLSHSNEADTRFCYDGERNVTRFTTFKAAHKAAIEWAADSKRPVFIHRIIAMVPPPCMTSRNTNANGVTRS